MNQALANVQIKLDKIGSSVRREFVTPAELLVLCAIHNTNAGGDPVVRLEEIPETTERNAMEAAQEELEKLQLTLVELEDNQELNLEIKEKRVVSLSTRIQSKQTSLDELQSVLNLRGLSPNDECNRLGSRYSSKVLKSLFPGTTPSLPTSFAEARKLGSVMTGLKNNFLVDPT